MAQRTVDDSQTARQCETGTDRTPERKYRKIQIHLTKKYSDIYTRSKRENTYHRNHSKKHTLQEKVRKIQYKSWEGRGCDKLKI